jgi:hypothetical protein
MKANDICGAIGRVVMVNISGDIAMLADLRPIIGRECKVIKQCRSGLVEVERAGKRYSVPMRNLDLVVGDA